MKKNGENVSTNSSYQTISSGKKVTSVFAPTFEDEEKGEDSQKDAESDRDNFSQELEQQLLYTSHIPTSSIQKFILGVGSSLLSLTDPYRPDMVSVSGEVLGWYAGLDFMRRQMMGSREGRKILEERPLINSHTVDVSQLRKLPDNTLGHAYTLYMEANSFSADERDDVHFVDDETLAYVMLRYRQIHDLNHTIFAMPTNLTGEVVVKWIESLQTCLPMCVGGAILGPLRFTPRQVDVFQQLRPWALTVGKECKPTYNVYFERRWEQDLDDLRDELRIPTPPDIV